MNVLAISGSLRAASINSAFCRAASRLAPAGMTIMVFRGLGALPAFNPDLEAAPPREVTEFRLSVGRADALIIASPEYAHGLSGAMKNALDWLVSFEGFVAKPVVLVNTSPRARHAHESLREVLRTMSATLLAEASMAIPLLGSCVTDEEMLESTSVSSQIQQSLNSLLRVLRCTAVSGPMFPVDLQ